MSKHQLVTAPRLLTLLLALLLTAVPVTAQTGKPDLTPLERLEWRNIGPANMGGRTTDVEGVPGNPNVVYVATGTGGLWKTVNGGISWKPLFDRQPTNSIGDIALQPGNPDVIWAGTGEANPRNSVSFGDGLYKSTDGGKTWTKIGLEKTERISRILVHPTNPDTVYVGALGHAFGPNEDRGVFMTTDGGKTWQKTLYVDAEHGIADMDIDPSNPNIVYAAVWKFERKPWTFTSGSEKGGVFRSIDGGKTWSKLTAGLPKLMGRISVKVAPSNPNVVYVIAETKEGTLYRSDDKGGTFRQVTKQANIVSRGFYYTDMRVDPTNENRVYAVASNLFVSIDGGRTFRTIASRIHVDHHAMWIDPTDPKRMWIGNDGGIAESRDQGESWSYCNNIPLGQFYHVFADNRQPYYHVMGGLQDNGSWVGPSGQKEPTGIINDDWLMVSFGDGFKTINHSDNPDLYLSLSQGGNLVRTDLKTHEQQLVRPYLGGGGGAAQNQKYRFNWNTPLIPSTKEKDTVYLAGNVVFKSTDFGKTWTRISEDLTTNDASKLKDAGGPVANENTAAEYYCTIISFAESPVSDGTLWAGTDDGNVWVTTDGGKKWENVVKNVKDLPANSPVSHLEGSRTNAQTAYLAFERHMFDDFKPYAFKTTDGGKSWTNISGNLPDKAYIHSINEDPKNPSILYAGTELGLYVSYTGGTNWAELNLKNLPHVPVHEIVVHPRENDLILATHGRSVWILDDATPVQQMSPEIAAKAAHLFPIRPAKRFSQMMMRYGLGDRVYAAPNPPYGAIVSYYFKDKPDAKVKPKLEILDAKGTVVRTIENIPAEKGLNRAVWNLNLDGPKPRRVQAGPPPGEGGFQFQGRGPQALPGNYTARLVVGETKLDQPVTVMMDPTLNVAPADLQAQFDAVTKLRDMQTNANLSLKTLDSAKEQLQNIKKVVDDQMPDAAKELGDAISGAIKRIDEVQAQFTNPPSEGLGFREAGKLVERLGGLSGTIDGGNAAPTPAMTEAMSELQPLYDKAMADATDFLKTALPKVNEKLKEKGAPTVIVPKPSGQ